MHLTYVPFPHRDDPQGCYTDAECHWVPNFDFSSPSIYSLVGPNGEDLRRDPLRLAQADDFIRHSGALRQAYHDHRDGLNDSM